MDQKYLSEIKAREQAATPGPWKAELSEGDCGKIGECPKGLEYCNDNCQKCEYWEISRGAWPHGPESVECGDYCFFTDTDAEFICHARTDIPALLKEIERLLSVEKSAKRIDEENRNLIIERDNLQEQLDMYGGDEGITAAIQERDTLKKELEMANITITKLSGENYQYSTSGFSMQKLASASDEVTHGEAEK